VIVNAMLFALATAQAASSEEISYDVTPRAAGDRTELLVTMRLRTAPGSELAISLPQDCYGTPDLQRFVRNFTTLAGSARADSAPGLFRFVADSAGEVRVRYLLSFDPAALAGSAFAPSVGPAHFHAAGCQWMLRPQDTQLRRRHVITVNAPDSSWHLYSSLPLAALRADTLASHSDLISLMIGGSRTKPFSFTIEGNRLDIFIAPAADARSDSLANVIATIVRRQREWFRDHSQKRYTVTILPRPNRLAGTAVPNLLVCFVGTERTIDEIIEIVAHEATHNWLPNKLEITLPAGDVRHRFLWLSEGVADYVSRKLLRDSGIISPDRFVELVNTDLANLATNPFATLTYPQVVEHSRTGNTGGPFFRLPYSRGALLTLIWDSELRARGRENGLREMIIAMLGAASVSGGRLVEDSLFAIAARAGVDMRAAFERHIIRGEEIVPPSHALGAGLTLETVMLPAASDAGFSVERSARSKRVFGVTAAGAAEAAGLRNGMEILSIENWNRLSPRWRPEAPISLTVLVNGAGRTFTVQPRGTPTQVRLFRGSR
jgi:predicted metalloprotease with PDZ domain